MNLRILHCSLINHQSAIEVIFWVVRMKNVKVRGERRIPRWKTNSAVKDEFRGKKTNTAGKKEFRGSARKITNSAVGSKFRARGNCGPYMSALKYISKLSWTNASKLARCGAKAERLPLRIRPMVENRFSTGTDDALRVKQFLAPTGSLCAIDVYIFRHQC